MLKVTVVNNIKLPKITLVGWLEEIADKVIIPDMIRGIDNSMAIRGGALPPNEPATIKRKGHGRQLVETGELRSSFYSKSRGKNKVIISLAGNRSRIGSYLQSGITAKGRLKQYLFFGISADAFDTIKSFMKRKIEELTSG